MEADCQAGHDWAGVSPVRKEIAMGPAAQTARDSIVLLGGEHLQGYSRWKHVQELMVEVYSSWGIDLRSTKEERHRAYFRMDKATREQFEAQLGEVTRGL